MSTFNVIQKFFQNFNKKDRQNILVFFCKRNKMKKFILKNLNVLYISNAYFLSSF